MAGSESELLEEDEDGKTLANLFDAGTFFRYESTNVYHFRGHIYQARDILAEDKSGLSDPYVRLIFGHCSATTRIIEQTVCPTFDQVLHFDIVLPGDFDQNLKLMPAVVCELFDYDEIGRDDFLGRLTTNVKIRSRHDADPPVLEWFDITRFEESAGQLLAAFELIPAEDNGMFDLPKAEPIKEDITNQRKVRFCWWIASKSEPVTDHHPHHPHPTPTPVTGQAAKGHSARAGAGAH